MKKEENQVDPSGARADREQWILASQMASAVQCLNAPFCEGGPAEGPNPGWIHTVAEEIAARTGYMALEDAICVLQEALAISVKSLAVIPSAGNRSVRLFFNGDGQYFYRVWDEGKQQFDGEFHRTRAEADKSL